MRHQHPNKLRSTWPPCNGTRWCWLQKRQKQLDMGRAYRSCHSTSSSNSLRRGRINNIIIVEINQTHESHTPTPTWCTPTWEGENEIQEITKRTYGATYPDYNQHRVIIFISTQQQHHLVSSCLYYRPYGLYPNQLWKCHPQTTTIEWDCIECTMGPN